MDWSNVFSQSFIDIVVGLSAIILTVTQTIKKTLEAIFKLTFQKWMSYALSAIIALVVSWPKITSDGLLGYIIFSVLSFLVANGFFKLIKTAVPGTNTPA